MLTQIGAAGHAAPCRAMTARVAIALLVLVGLGQGCYTHRPLRQEVSLAIEGWQRPYVQSESGERSGHAASESTPGAGATEANDDHDSSGSSQSVSQLQQWIIDTLARNPSVLAAMADARAKLEHVAQVTALPDPLLRFAVRPEPIRTAAGNVHFTFAVGQKIPLPARLERTGRIAEAEVRMAIEQLNATRLQVIADVERAFYQVYLNDRSLELTRAHRVSLEDLEQVVATQYRVGKAEQHDLLRTQTEIAKLRDDESRLTRRRESAVAALNRLSDHPPTRAVHITGPIRPQKLDADGEQLIALAVEHNPDLAILIYQAKRDKERVKLADLRYWPDVTIGAEWTYLEPRDAFEPPNTPREAVNRMSETGTDSWALMLQFNVPIWFDRIESAKQEARSRLLKTQHQRRAAINQTTFRVFDAWTRVQTQQDTIEVLETTLIPQVRQTYNVSLAAYEAGRSSFLVLIDNWRQLLDFELMLHRELAELETAFSQLQREVGLQLIRREIISKPQGQGEQP
ncbi:MAG: TolC family protein [Phycisphaerales bacterium]|nr:MAG: TolC family protein [Phycisphaerales bacterium]